MLPQPSLHNPIFSHLLKGCNDRACLISTGSLFTDENAQFFMMVFASLRVGTFRDEQVDWADISEERHSEQVCWISITDLFSTASVEFCLFHPPRQSLVKKQRGSTYQHFCLINFQDFKEISHNCNRFLYFLPMPAFPFPGLFNFQLFKVYIILNFVLFLTILHAKEMTSITNQRQFLYWPPIRHQ